MYVCTRMYVCTYVPMYLCTSVPVYACTHVRMYLRAYGFQYVCMHVCKYACMYVCTHMYIHTEACIGVRTYIRMYASLDVCPCRQKENKLLAQLFRPVCLSTKQRRMNMREATTPDRKTWKYPSGVACHSRLAASN